MIDKSNNIYKAEPENTKKKRVLFCKKAPADIKKT